MNAIRQATWLFILLILLAASGWYFASSKKNQVLADSLLSQLPDAIVEQLQIQQFSPEGQLQNFLIAEQMRHFPAKDAHWLKDPHILITKAHEAPFEIRAKEAKASHGFEKIHFKHQVEITEHNKAGEVTSRLLTERISYYPKKQYAFTRLAVRLEQAGSTLHSVGLKAYLAEKRVTLLSQARGTYVPKTS